MELAGERADLFEQEALDLGVDVLGVGIELGLAGAEEGAHFLQAGFELTRLFLGDDAAAA